MAQATPTACLICMDADPVVDPVMFAPCDQGLSLIHI